MSAWKASEIPPTESALEADGWIESRHHDYSSLHCLEIKGTFASRGESVEEAGRNRWQIDGSGAFGVVIRNGIDPRAHRVTLHEICIERLEQARGGRDILHGWIEPAIIVRSSEDDGHPVMDVGKKSVWSGRQDGAAFDDFSLGILPFVP